SGVLANHRQAAMNMQQLRSVENAARFEPHMILAMKKSVTSAAILFLLAAASFAEPTIPQPQGFVNDFASKLSPDTKQQLENLLTNFSNRTGIEVTFVTVNF